MIASLQYRHLLPTESKIYREIRLESLKTFPEAFGATYQEALETKKFRLENDIETQTTDRFVYGAFSGRHLIGICTFVKNKDHTGGIYQMYVKKEFQGKNVAYELIHSTIKEARKRCNNIVIFLEVTPDNERAYHFYKKTGFEEVMKKDSSTGILMQYSKEDTF
ncbi:GNAT family N-acetyltransferase [Chryseobacterium indologenes]|uniref:GNAT family N-acetyltransferase n=1 Tax=Chryseobacterium indologenes TaxID=253 RepID=UPI000BFB24D6|nr:GNAT family N-acetyltransferase [Chryseobacterium indologenes]ATN04799.1 GNAT family N-acetyltransferase [Chryseobacterium indologenes]AYY86450.1 GNAT family N-acetyltransferase [Chryseobacterium indologenes]QIX83341.1 GNAT family N-acetyltransferase [Chryseobacterium indologenes]UDQ53030.1 GNAT family N-acetyltransferase [Chryseobacterium indologenes]